MSNSDKLTKEQEVQLEAYREKWAKEPMIPRSQAEVESIVGRMYVRMGVKKMPRVILAPNPIECIRLGALEEKALADAEKAKKNKKFKPKPYTDLELAEAMTKVQWYCGYWWLCWAATYDFAVNVLGVKDTDNALPDFSDYCRCMPFCVPLEHVCIVCKEVKSVHFEDSRLHNEKGPSFAWEGHAMYSLKGITVSEKTVMCPDQLTADEIDEEENAEARRVMIERLGIGVYLQRSGATIVDGDHETARKGAAPRVLLQDRRGERWLVGTDGSTSRTYYMPVPKEAKTCREAHEAICGFDETLILNKS